MRKLSIIFICSAIIFSCVACTNNVRFAETENQTIVSNDVEFTETENKTIVSNDGTEYAYVGHEGKVLSFGEWDFVGHVKGEKKTFVHLSMNIKTGMYSVNGSQDVLARYFPDNEFAAMYVKSELLETEIKLDNCIRFEFVKGLPSNNTEITSSTKGITDCDVFLNEIKNGQTATDARLRDLVEQPDGTCKNYYVYGYVCGVIQEDLNLFIPLQVMSFDDKAYSIIIDDIEYVLPQEWLDKLITK